MRPSRSSVADPPSSVAALLAWADAPLATAEVVEIMGAPEAQLRSELARCASAIPAGAEFYWVGKD